MLTTDQKGAIAEMGIAWHAWRLGIEVYRPIAEGGRFDMIFLLGEKLGHIRLIVRSIAERSAGNFRKSLGSRNIAP